MSTTIKKTFAETDAPGRIEYFIGDPSGQLSPSPAASSGDPAAAKERAAADPSVIVTSAPSSGASDASDLPAGEKAVPFGLPCITDEKLLLLMAQDSVNGRIAALQASPSTAQSSIDDEPATVPITVGGSVTGVIDVAGDMDDITVTLVAGQRYMISLMGSGASALADSYVEMFNPSMVSLGHDDDGGVGRNSVMTITAAVGGTYTIRASAFGTSGVGQYTVDVREMGTDSVPATIGGAVAISQGITFGFRETTSDSDYYKVSLVAGKTYSFSLAGGTDHESTFNPIAAGEIDTIINLRGPSGTILASNDDINYPSDASSAIQFTATSTGDFYLEATAYPASAAPGGNTGGYVIDFREVPPPDPLDSIDWGTAANIPTVMVDGVRTAYIYFAAAGENFGENARPGDPAQAASGTNGTLLSHGWSGYEKAQFMLAMQEYSKILGIAYVETTDSSLATFRVITNSSYAYGAYAYPQDPAYGTQRGIMVFNVDNRGWELDSADPAVTVDGLGRGGFSWATILHEAGHAHGLAHPHDTGGGSAVMLGVTGPYSLGAFNLNQQVYTQMSYNDGWHTHPDGSLTNGDPTGWRSDAGWNATMGAFDIAVLQARYGVVPPNATGDTVYTLKDVNAEGTYFETIYDTGGIDTIAYGGVRGAQIDLNTATLDYSVTGGGIVSFVHNLPGETTAQAIKGGFTIAKGVVIENATGGSGNDVLIGNAAANVLTGNGGNDIFIGGGGDDTFRGGTGDDDYQVDDSGDLVAEEAGEGTDVVRTGFAIYVLPANVENLTARNDIAHDFRGNSSNNVIIGGAGNDTLNGGAGADRTQGGLGNDTHIVDNAGDVVVELAGQGSDTVVASVSYALAANVENLQALNIGGTAPLALTGNGLANFIWGTQGNNVIDGGAGADFLIGYAGDDVYIVDNAGDLTYEDVGGGSDTVAATVSYVLRSNIENLQAADIAGTAALSLTGNGLNNFIWGTQGNNVLDGAGGADFMLGYAGDDIYHVDNAGDIAYELDGAGLDTVVTSIGYTLAAHVENLQALNIGGSDPLSLTGNDLRNFIWGTQGSNVIDGGAGADVMIGYGGNDVYFVDNAGDVTYEEAGGGSDTVAATADYALGANIENLQAANIGGTEALSLTGNEQGNFIWGTQGSNVLSGRGGNDRIFGFAGADQFLFDTQAGAANADWLDDFQAGTDKILLDNAVFTALTDGALSSSAFVTGTSALDADDRIIFDAASGSIFYDADGNGVGEALLIAVIPVGQNLTAADFLVV